MFITEDYEINRNMGVISNKVPHLHWDYRQTMPFSKSLDDIMGTSLTQAQHQVGLSIFVNLVPFSNYCYQLISTWRTCYI